MFIPTLIETIRVEGGRAPLWYLHLRRLSESCRALGVPLPLRIHVPDGPDRVLRMEVGPSGVETTERPLPSPSPLRLITSRVTHRPYPHKTTDRAAFDQARAEAVGRGADDGILLTPAGEIAECAIWSLFWWEDEGLVAPPLALGVLRSVSRLRVEELLASPPHALTPSRLHAPSRPHALTPSRPLFAANAVRGIVPVASLDGVAVRQDPRTDALARAFWP
jgi:branched-subunit amino acid aminotransferase/4-amino-4-deoxychorismate lyase